MVMPGNKFVIAGIAGIGETCREVSFFVNLIFF